MFYDKKGRAAGVYSRVFEGATLSFKPKDENGESLFLDSGGTTWNIEGHGVSGPKKGAALAAAPFARARWYAWASALPKTEVLRPGKR